MADRAHPHEPDLLDSSEAGGAAVRGAAVRVAGYFAGIVITVVSAALLFRHLGVEDTGRYVTVLALIAIVTGVTDIGLTTIGLRELAVRDRRAQHVLLTNLLGLRLVLAVVGVAAITGFAALVGYGSTMVLGTLLAGVSVVAISVQSTLVIVLMVRLRLGWVTLLDLLRQVVLVVAIVALVVADAGLLAFLAIQGPAAIVALAVTVLLVRRDAPLRPSFATGEWRALLREVLPFAAATIVVTIYFRSALLVLGLVSDETETGHFGAAFRVAEVLLALPGLMVSAAFPIFSRSARDDHERLAYGVDRVFQTSLLAGAGIMLALVLGAPVAIDVIAGPAFAPSAGVLRILAVALMVSFGATTLFYALLSLRMHGTILLASCLVLAFSVVLAAILGRAHGATGAALSTVVAELVGVAVAVVALRRRHPALVPSLGPVLRVAAAAGVGFLVVLAPVPALVAAVAGTALYAGAAIALRAVPPELLEAFLARRRVSAGAGSRPG